MRRDLRASAVREALAALEVKKAKVHEVPADVLPGLPARVALRAVNFPADRHQVADRLGSRKKIRKITRTPSAPQAGSCQIAAQS